MDVGRLGELVEALSDRGRGVTLLEVFEGAPMGGFGSTHRYKFDGWEVGWMTPGGGGELAVGPTIAEAVDAALDVLARAE